MKTLEKISAAAGKYMAIIVLAIAALALFVPDSLNWIKTSWVNTLLGIVMFGMGLTIRASDFKIVFSHPKDILIGCLAQFTVMPVLAWVLTMVFQLDTALAVGVILVGTCPGGTSSNVMTYLSKGDVALSVGMTSVSTILAPFLTPMLTWIFAGQRVDVDIVAMFLSVIKVVIVPIVLGIIVQKLLGKKVEEAGKVLPLVSVVAIVMIVAAVVSANSEKLLTNGAIIIVVVILHNMLGYGVGYLIAKLLRLDLAKCKAVSIEVGMQNSGLATSLAGTHFAQYPLATIPGAVFSVWHNISGSIVANIMSARVDEQEP